MRSRGENEISPSERARMLLPNFYSASINMGTNPKNRYAYEVSFTGTMFTEAGCHIVTIDSSGTNVFADSICDSILPERYYV